MRNPWLRLVAALACLVGSAWTQCSVDHREDKKAGILLTDLTIAGTKAISATELAGITGELIGGCYDEESEVGERIRAAFQDSGYFTAEVKDLRTKVGDPLGVPKPVTMEADVTEGLRYHVGEISFVENHAFGADKLRAEFPLKAGAVFSRSKVAAGLESLRKLYGKNGYVDWMCIPETVPGSNGIINLKLTTNEGPQYRLQKVEFVGNKESTGRLLTEWKLEAGSVYDTTYLNQFIEENRDSLPAGFGRNDVKVGKDCPRAEVQLRVMVGPAEDASRTPLKDVACEEHSDRKN